MRKYSKYFYWGMLVINIMFAGYFINRWVSAKPTAPQIPSELLTENSLVNAEILRLSGNPNDRQFAIALMSSKANICAENKIGDFFRTTRSERPDIKLYGLFSRSTSDDDISTFKDNLGLDFEVIKMSSELATYWEQVSEKYDTPAIIILKNRNGLVASQNLSEIRKALEAY